MPISIEKFLRNLVLLVVVSNLLFSFSEVWTEELAIQLHDTYLVVMPIFIVIPALSSIAYLLSFLKAAWHKFERLSSNRFLAVANFIFSLVSGYLFFYLRALDPGLLPIVSVCFITSLCTLVLITFKLKIQ